MSDRCFGRWIAIAFVSLGSLLALSTVHAATITFSAPSTMTVGQTFQLVVAVDADSRAINTVAGTVTWDPDVLLFQSADTEKSLVQYWVTKPIERADASLKFSGGLPSPGYSGDNGHIVTLNFTAVASGSTKLTVQDISILANDGIGGDISSGNVLATYHIDDVKPVSTSASTSGIKELPMPILNSTTHADSRKWYRDPVVQFSWTVPTGLRGVSYSLTTSPDTEPDEIIDSNSAFLTATITSGGAWYIHLRGQYQSGWSATNHLLIQYDQLPPEFFTPQVIQDRGLSDPTPELSFFTTDTHSGIDSYTYAIDGGSETHGISPVSLASLGAGQHTVIVTAKDRAGNSRTSSVAMKIEGYTAPTITAYPSTRLIFDQMMIRGMAYVGDIITIYANGAALGQVVTGSENISQPADILVRVPWSFSSDQSFRPGTIKVTATATSADGQVSVMTDPQYIHVSGKELAIFGRTYASFSVITPFIVLILFLIVAILAVMIKIGWTIKALHQQQKVATADVASLRQANRLQIINRQQLDSALAHIEQDMTAHQSRPLPVLSSRLNKPAR